MSGLTKSEMDVLEWGEYKMRQMRWHIVSCRRFRRETIDRLVEKKMLKSVGMVELQDADGFSRDICRQGWALTAKGRRQLAKGAVGQ